MVSTTQPPCKAVHANPLTELNDNAGNCREGTNHGSSGLEKEEKNSSTPFANAGNDKENLVPPSGSNTHVPKMNPNLKSFSTKGTCEVQSKEASNWKSLSTGRALRQTSLQLCMQMTEGEKVFGTRVWDSTDSEHSSSLKIWEYSDSEAAPASTWSTLPNRALLCKPLPLDVGRCTCVIIKEELPEGLRGGSLYALYTNEGRGRKDRKLAVAHHRRRYGKSLFTVAQNIKGLLATSDDSYVGVMTANLVGSKYHIWDQGSRIGSLAKQSRPLLSVVAFAPTVATWTGSYRSIGAYIPRNKALQTKNAKQTQNNRRLPDDWRRNAENVLKLCSRAPHYNRVSKQYELDFRDRGRAGLKIRSSVKNFQLIHEESRRQTVLQMGRVDKSKYVIDFRSPLMGYQAFCICLASIDSKLCCTI